MEKPHALVLPVPATQGHINPLLNFSLQLAARGGFIITFVNTDKAHKRILEASQQSQLHSDGEEVDIRFVSIPDSTDAPSTNNLVNVPKMLDGMAAQQGLLEDMVISSRGTPHPITCLIFDCFLPWAQAMADKLGIKNAAFWTPGAATLATAMEMRSGRLSTADDAPIEEVTAGLPIRSTEWLSKFPFQDPERTEWFKQRASTWPQAACLVLNTLQELEAPSLAAVAAAAGCAIRMHCVGPLFPPPTVRVNGTSFLPEQSSTCVDWLDQQAPRSVLYVSFGSVVSLPAQKLEELALGVELSKQPFLWVARDSAGLLPEGFLDRTRGRGPVVNWAPQVRVLAHAAVGGFLTHCGWNSTIESVHMGVPMLCYPIAADQPANEVLITRCWGIGTGMRKDEHLDLVTRSEVQTAIVAHMNSEELHSKAAAWKAASHRAVEQGGTSYNALQAVMHDLVGSGS